MGWCRIKFVIEFLQSVGIGVLMGFLIYFSGVGAGSLLVPVIVFFYGLPASVAVGTASAYSTLTKIMAGVEHWRRGNIDWAIFRRLIVATALGVVLAAGGVNWALHHYPHLSPNLQLALELFIVITIALALFLTIKKRQQTQQDQQANLSAYKQYGIGLLIGMIMGLTGVGGGVLLIPAIFLMGCGDTKKVVGTSVIAALSLSLLTAVIYAGGGQFDWTITLHMALGSVIGIPLASLLLKRVSDKTVFYSVIGLISCALSLMIFNLFNRL